MSTRRRDPEVWSRVTIASTLLTLGALGRGLPAHVVTGAVAAALIVAIIAEEALADRGFGRSVETSEARPRRGR